MLRFTSTLYATNTLQLEYIIWWMHGLGLKGIITLAGATEDGKPYIPYPYVDVSWRTHIDDGQAWYSQSSWTQLCQGALWRGWRQAQCLPYIWEQVVSTQPTHFKDNKYNSNSRPSHCPLLNCFHSMVPFCYVNDVDRHYKKKASKLTGILYLVPSPPFFLSTYQRVGRLSM